MQNTKKCKIKCKPIWKACKENEIKYIAKMQSKTQSKMQSIMQSKMELTMQSTMQC